MRIARTADEYPHVLLTSPGALRDSPPWIPGRFSPEVVPAKQIPHLDKLAQLTVVRAPGLKSVLAKKGFLPQLAERLRHTPAPAKVVFVLDANSPGADAQGLHEILAFFDRASDVEFVRGVGEAEFAINEAVAKIWAQPAAETAAAVGPDPLGKIKSVIAAAKDLRSSSGRLSARKVAETFGLSLNALASCLETTRQALSKTPDSKSIQGRLFPFERIARLRTVLAPDEFRAWLNMPNELLDDMIPLQLIRRGRTTVVADLAEDMLTGSPT